MYYIEKYFSINKIEHIPSDAEFSKFVSMRIKLAWVTNTRTDKVFEISQIPRVARSIYEKDLTNY